MQPEIRQWYERRIREMDENIKYLRQAVALGLAEKADTEKAINAFKEAKLIFQELLEGQ